MTIREITPTLRCKNAIKQSVGPRIIHQKENRSPRRKKHATREQFLAMLGVDTPTPVKMSSLGIETIQLHAALLDLYMPRSGGDQITFKSLLEVTSTSEALSTAATAFSLMLVGRATNDSRLLLAACVSYSSALHRTHQEIQNPENSKCVTFGTVLILSEYDAIQKAPLIDCANNPHSSFLLKFMDQCCADLRTDGHTGQTLPKGLWQSHHRLVAALDAVNDRKCPFQIDMPSYYNQMRPVDEVAALAVLTLCTSALLESIDALCQQDLNVCKPLVLEALRDFVQLERELHLRMTDYYANINQLPFWYADSASFAFGTCHNIRILARTAYNFVDISGAMLHVAYWTCLLSLVEAQLAISHSFPDAVELDDIDIFRLHKLRKEYTDHVMMSIPFLGEGQNGWAGRTTAMRPLRFLLTRFKKRCEWQNASWCVAMLKNLSENNRKDDDIHKSAPTQPFDLAPR